jgi:hypothetical protein
MYPDPHDALRVLADGISGWARVPNNTRLCFLAALRREAPHLPPALALTSAELEAAILEALRRHSRSAAKQRREGGRTRLPTWRIWRTGLGLMQSHPRSHHQAGAAKPKARQRKHPLALTQALPTSLSTHTTTYKIPGTTNLSFLCARRLSRPA